MNETPHSISHGNDGHHIIELLCEVDSLIRDELKNACEQNCTPEIQYLLVARLNVNQAIEAIYDKASHNYCQ
jgi:hypothetical protein